MGCDGPSRNWATESERRHISGEERVSRFSCQETMRLSGARPVTRTGSEVRSSGSANAVKSTSVRASLPILGRYSGRYPERTADGSVRCGALALAAAAQATRQAKPEFLLRAKLLERSERTGRPGYATSFSGTRTRGTRLSPGLGASSMYPHCRHSRYPP